MESIGIIGGGQMAEALIKGFLQKKIFNPKAIYVSEPSSERRNFLKNQYEINVFFDNKKIWEKAKKIILAVKPQVIEKVLEEVKNFVTSSHLVLTIAAGIPLKVYEFYLGKEKKIIRIMPNCCALINYSVSVLSPNKNVTEKEIKEAEKIFSAIGKVYILEESYMDAVTALSGSGPAFFATIIEAFIDAGVLVGLSRKISKELVIHTLLGTCKLLENKDPYEIKSMVTSPGGTAITGEKVFYKEGLSGIIMEAVYQAFKRSEELGKKF